MKHAIFSMSKTEWWLACPYGARLASRLPERPSSVKGIEGTRVHTVIEHALRTGQLLQRAPWDTEPDPDAMPDAQVVEYVRSYVQNLGPGRLLIEHRVTLTHECFGTLDIGHVPEKADQGITVLDYKNGGWDVEARGNKQLLSYMATFLDAYPQVTWFRGVIFQPNSWRNGANPNQENGFKQHPFSRSEVEEHRAKVLAATANNSGPKPGPHCRWCPAFSQCEAMSNDTAFLMASIARDPMTLEPAQLVRMLRIVRALGDMRDSLEAALTAHLKAGAQVEGAELKKSVKWETWNDPTHAAIKLYALHGAKGVKPINPAAAKKLSPAAQQYAAVAAHRPEPEFKASY